MEEFKNYITLIDTEGNEVDFALLDTVTYEGEAYAVLLPPDGENDTDVIVLKTAGEGDALTLSGIEDEAALEAVLRLFDEG